MQILLEGRPGIGKTTVAAALAELLLDQGRAVAGFTTAEIRERGQRVGFRIETFTGERTTLAHVTFPGPPRVGRYGVDIEALERLTLPALERRPERAVVIVDELGKMELASERFRDAVAELFESAAPLVATVQIARHPFTDALKRRRDADTIRVTQRNRACLPHELAERLAS